ncbi:Uncharacterised protein [Yersinia enterocolitica]|nr:Uncharacterised protein [Yersinia enterocolitica]
MKRRRSFTISAAGHQNSLIVIQLDQLIDDMQAVRHHRNIVEFGQVRDHL